MISHIRGEIASTGGDSVVIDVGGIGYSVRVPQPLLHELSDKKEIKLHTYLSVREDALTLYGFATANELEVFKLLISVTGVGPQVALNILSGIKIEELAAAIIYEDEKALRRVPGIGQKNAKRLILELKDKMKKKMGSDKSYSPERSIDYDAVSALVSLGFPQQEAQSAVSDVSREMKEPTVQALIKAALSKLKAH